MSEAVRILLVDRDKVALQNLEHVLQKSGCLVTKAAGGLAALKLLETQAGNPSLFEVIVADLELDSLDGGKFLQQCFRRQPATEVILVADNMAVSSVVDAIRQGAFQYLIKPLRLDELRHMVQLAAQSSFHKQIQQGIRHDLVRLREELPLITRDPVMLRLLEQARRAASMDLPILITGETGTGKEILARFLHDASSRSRQPFVAVNCGAFNEELLANELFGHGREAFTGAVRDRKGLVETAHGGTLFLDEIGEMSLTMQVKLLRVIQEKELRRLGVTTPVTVDVRYIAATNRPIQQEVDAGRFRRDLFYRLNVIDFHLPPLCQRQGDITLLVQYFVEKYNQLARKQITGFSKSALALMMRHKFPGNVRELENIVQRSMAFATGPEVTEEDLPDYLRLEPPLDEAVFNKRLMSLEHMEQEYILWVCEQMEGNQTMAAKILGLDRVSLWRRLKKIQSTAEEAGEAD
ncbi:MAG: sigma-54-dependent Fis family transcriptional regulator [Magnetococcales bacterium]|nr:sigma-54-dependent Fis family transcriptional regulator [Magnetococcales bacterium]